MSCKKKRLVVIGNGMAGVRAIESLLALAPHQYEVILFGSESYGLYNRIMLSPVLASEMSFSEIISHPFSWYEDNDITLYSGETVIEINRIKNEVTSDLGRIVPYDRLLIATGSRPAILPIPGNRLSGVVSYRDIADVQAMLTAAATATHAVVIGGGLLGLEAAYGLNKQGIAVTVVHIMPTLMDRQLDREAASLLKAHLEVKGISFEMETFTDAIIGSSQVEAVRFKGGRQIKCDLVVMAVGIRPNIELAKRAGLACGRAILVNDTMQTYDPKIYAVGECAEHRGVAYGLVAPLYEQADVCANHLAEWGIIRYEGSVVATRLKVTGVNLFSAGDFMGDEDGETVLFRDPSRSIYKKLVIAQNRLIGVLLYGEVNDGAWYLDLIESQRSIASIRHTIIFGRALSEVDRGIASVAT